ncbi:MAG TPA: hypothetical protein V6C78_13000 [Crinalium sp.]|jgi:hypothetical protein
MSTLPQELRYLLQGIVVTAAVVGAIATVAATLYLGLLLLISGKASLLHKLTIPGLASWLLLGTLLQVPIWIGITRIHFVSRPCGRLTTGFMIASAFFALIGGLILPR